MEGEVQQAIFSPDGRQLAVAARDYGVCLVDRVTGRVQCQLLDRSTQVHAVCFSPDGRRLVSAGDDAIVRIWDAATGKLEHELHGHTEQIFAAAFHPDGTRLATGGRDRAIRIWDPATGEQLARLPGHTGYVFSLAFSPDGSTLISGSEDCTVRIWETGSLAKRRAAARALQSLRPEAERIVERLYQELREPAKLVERIRADVSLSESLQQACWHAVLRRATAEASSKADSDSRQI